MPAVGMGAVSRHTTRWHPETEGNPRSDPSDNGGLGIQREDQTVRKNNLAQVTGLNSLAFSCLVLFPLPRVIKRLFFFFRFCLVSRSTNTEKVLLPHKTWKPAGLPVPESHPARSHAGPNLQQLPSASLQMCFCF